MNFLRMLIILLLAECSTVFAQSPSGQLNTLFETEWQSTLKEMPTEASYLGDKRYNDRWPDVSLAAIQTRSDRRRAALRRLKEIDVAQLSARDRLNFDLFRRQLEVELEEASFKPYLMPLNQRDGFQDESSVADAISFRTVKDYEDWLARLRSIPEYADQTTALMRLGIASNMIQPRVVMQRVPAQLKRQIVEDPSTSLYYKPFKSMAVEIEQADRDRMQQEALDVIREKVVPAYRRFYGFFEREYLPACPKGIGAKQLTNGSSFYAFLARKYTTTNLTPHEIHEIGLSEVARIRSEMERVRESVGFRGTMSEFFEHLRTAPQYRYTDENDLMMAYVQFCKRVDPLLPRVFNRLPRIPYHIEAIPAHMAPDTTTAYYRPPSADGSRPGTYFVNLYKPESRPKYEIPALSLHESVPGHHLQIGLATEMQNVPEFRKHSYTTAYVEGWGLYSESLGDEMGLYDDPYSKFGQLTYEMWRAVRLVVDTGMHSMDWTRDRAIQYFKDNAAKTELDIVNEIDRYIAWPGQALAYKIGELKIKELRQRAQKAQGNQFDLREFHNVILSDGALPLDLLERQVNEWIQTTK